MTTWNYIKGSEKDFEGAPDWAVNLYTVNKSNTLLKVWSNDSQYQYANGFSGAETCAQVFNRMFPTDLIYPVELIAQRELVKSVNDDRLLASLNDLPQVSEKYPKHDMVNHPSHYTQGGIECIDAITAATVGKTGIEAVCVANVIKYLWRYEEKNGLEDVKKARWYLERLINELSEGE
ncbi:TPA: DUF3310 domain-containing protein [Escherichia coli]